MIKTKSISFKEWKELPVDDKVDYKYNASNKHYDYAPYQEISIFWYERLTNVKRNNFTWDTASQRYIRNAKDTWLT